MLIAGNWKMNTDVASGHELATNVASGATAASEELDGVDLAVCPPFVHLPVVAEALGDSGVGLGAQNMHAETDGAYTGEVSAPMLVSTGCTYVILGHSERREYFGETDASVRDKMAQAHAHDLVPIVCVGETLEQRNAGTAKDVVRKQVRGALEGIDLADGSDLVVAYEPVWAIGTGESATPEQAQEMHAFLRGELADRYDADVAEAVELLYGGSMKDHNCESLLGQPDIDGGLIGGASLQAEHFLTIAKTGAQVG